MVLGIYDIPVIHLAKLFVRKFRFWYCKLYKNQTLYFLHQELRHKPLRKREKKFQNVVNLLR